MEIEIQGKSNLTPSKYIGLVDYDKAEVILPFDDGDVKIPLTRFPNFMGRVRVIIMAGGSGYIESLG